MHHQRTFTGSQKALGPDHLTTLTAAGNLAVLYSNQDKYGEAAGLHQHAFARCEAIFGPDHPDTPTSAANLCCEKADMKR